MDKEKIKQQAKQIMDEFMSALEKVKNVPEEFGIEREPNMRVVVEKPRSDPEFKKRLLKNAPKTKEGCVLAEKKSW